MLPALLYSAEPYTLYRKNIKRLPAVQRRPSDIFKEYPGAIADVEVLRRAGMECIEASLADT